MFGNVGTAGERGNVVASQRVPLLVATFASTVRNNTPEPILGRGPCGESHEVNWARLPLAGIPDR